ncbi:MAG: substrate-binding domain-containing protein [Bryobacteraceae bacterium]|nr:substrate-binding domain-containing protein [Bryobacteraceae bacterium]MDW8377245.1 substrate-binding domain-containing protein [Bryobacterales bacterium]
MSKVDRYYIEAGGRLLDVLELFSRYERLRLSDVVADLDLAKSTAFRCLYTLEKKGYIERARDGQTWRRRPRRVGLLSVSEKIPFVAEVEKGIQSLAEAAGFTLLVRRHYFNPSLAVEGTTQLLAEGASLLVVYNPDEHVSHVIADRCACARTPVIAITFPVPGACLFGINNYRAGLTGGEALGQYVLTSWNRSLDHVVLLDIPGSSPAQSARMTGMLEGLRQFVAVPDEAVSHFHAGRESLRADELMKNFLRSNPQMRRIAVLCYNDVNAMGALRATEECGRTADVRILSQGGVAEVRAAIARRGSALWGAVAHFPERFGARLVPLIQNILRGEPMPQTVYTEHALLTRASLRLYYR